MAKQQIKNYVFTPGIGSLGSLYPNACQLLENNRAFLISESIAYINYQISNSVTWPSGYTYNQTKCQRDLGFVLDAYLYNLQYGGNDKLIDTIKYYWDQDVAQVDGNRIPEIDTHAHIGDLIANYVLTNTVYAKKGNVSQQVDTSLTSESYQYTPTAASYEPTTGELVLTIGSHNLKRGSSIRIAAESLVFTCALDGHASTHAYPRSTGVPNGTGTDPYYNKPVNVTAITSNTITVNIGISSDTSYHIFVSATTNAITASAVDKINTMAQNTVDVITNGLSSMPDREVAGVGKIKIQGRYGTDELLLISNTTRSEIVYNFASLTTGASVEIKEHGDDDDFPKYLQTTDAVTTITLNYDTSSHAATDEVQIFVEQKEVRTRPYDFGTDAIERMRMAAPQAMLDADFEYGLQPTKWAAIGTLRGYPSVYEVPGTDTEVSSVATDASSGTSGVGQSLITVTTVAPHGFSAGDAITIKALENSVLGFARAEGSFVIATVPTPTTFTYYAKAKVGTVSGTVLSTGYTQLRKAGFYTGASIGTPTFTVASQGFSGTIVTELIVPSGSTIIPFDGPSPGIGAPLSGNTNILLGTQVAGVFDTSAGGGTYLTAVVEGDYQPGDTEITVVDSTGIIPNLAVDSGNGTATFVEDVVGNVVYLTSGLTDTLVGSTATYNSIFGSNISPVGTGAVFDISRTAGAYIVDAIVDGGLGYEIGDRLILSGADLGGATPTNDLTLRVTAVDASGTITTVVVTDSIAFDGSGNFTNVTPDTLGNEGSGAAFDITINATTFSSVIVNTGATTSGYRVGDRLQITGNAFSPNGALGTNDLIIEVTTVGVSGDITGISWDGVAPNAFADYGNPTYSTSGSGSGIDFTVTRNGTTYSVEFANGGIDFLATDTIVVSGLELGGSTPTNDLTITVDNTDGFGSITASSVSGVAVNIQDFTNKTATPLVGSGAAFDIDISGGSYTVTLVDGGTNYGGNQEFLIPGTDLLGVSPDNDLSIQITAVNGSGTITNISYSGTALDPDASYTSLNPSNETPTGSSATFRVDREPGAYTVIISAGGNSYKVGNRIRLQGSQLGGLTPDNDIVLTVTGASSGVITTVDAAYTATVVPRDFDFISTITTTDATTGVMARLESINYEALATIEIDFENAHGLVPGDSFIVTVASDDGSNNHTLAAGSYFTTEIPSIASLRYQARAAGLIDTTSGDIVGTVYPRPDSFFIHRPFDGGVQLGTGGPQHGAQAIRQSKKYIRYQSGKGIMYTTGALFAPSYDLRSITAEDVEVGSLITVVTDDNDHGVQVGGIIRLLGVETPGYNSGRDRAVPPDFDYTVVDVVDERTFKVRAQRRLGATNAVLGFGAQMSVISWHGATVRSGIFDDQNGIFWEYNGTDISVNQRTGTFQCAGTIAIEVDSNEVIGSNTRFRDQVKAGDRVIIKGMTHVVSHVTDDTTLYVTPDFRGVTDVTAAKMMLITDKKVKQSDFNLDRLDGTGPSGYDIDIAKMQMIGIQYTWYGAGFIDFMLRGSDGNFVFAHRMRNSNVNTEAFMRSGNLPVRYEVTNEGPPGQLASDMNSTQDYIELVNGEFFPDSGVVYVDNEIISFASKDGNTLTDCIRADTFTNFQAGADRSYTAGPATTHDARTGVVLISNTITPLISHWGSAFLTDGGFDEDRGYIFSYSETGLTASTAKQTAFLIRLAPSVSNAIVGDLGERELLNRAQLLLQGIEITSDGYTGSTPIIGGIIVEGILNPQNFPLDPGAIEWSQLNTLAQGGQPSFAQVAAGGAVTWTTNATSTTSVLTQISTATITITTTSWNDSYTNNSNYAYFTQASWEAALNNGATRGTTITGTNIRTGTTVQSWEGPYNFAGVDYYRVTFNQTNQSRIGNSANKTLEFGGSLTGRNYMYATKASWEAAAALGANTRWGATTTTAGTFPANTLINSIQGPLRFGSTEYYTVTFNNSYSSTLTGGSGTVTVGFTEPAYGQPGETVFSFIAQPGERSELVLSELKELTNTPLGGRGTYPNGPDVLAINIYKVSGANTTANITLKWGEAQA